MNGREKFFKFLLGFCGVMLAFAVFFSFISLYFLIAVAACLVGAIIFAYLLSKEQNKANKKSSIKARTVNEIINDKSIDDYDKLVEWWSDCDEKAIQSNSLLLGAYRVMWLYNEVSNGGFGQFFDFVEDWDMERTSKLFKWLLPEDYYVLFVAALQAHSNGEDCEKYNGEFNYTLMEEQILPKIAERVVNIYKAKVTLTEYDLIEGITPYLKSQGYKKQNKRWTKNIGEFTLNFFIQGSAYDIDSYYIRPGIFINGIVQGGLDYYGHFNIDIKQQSLEQVIKDYEQFVREWTDKPLIKSRLEKFEEWEQRNPLEKRRTMTGKDRYKKDPVPEGCDLFFAVNDAVKKHISENY